jgi:glutamyl-tRNA reductase
MRVAITGLNHRSAPVEVREKLAIKETELPAALAELKSTPGVAECAVLSTCNRVEIMLAIDDDCSGREAARDFLSRFRPVDGTWLENYLYSYDGEDAIKHLFRVASSIDSMIVGEPQILGQLKAAYSVARQEGTVSSLLNVVMSKAFAVAKRVRTETEIGSSAVSVSYAAVELAREIFGALKNKSVMLIGAGKMSELAGRHLARSGAHILVTNRTQARAQQLASSTGGTMVPYERFRAHLPEVDIVITSSGVSEYLLEKGDMKRVLDARRNRPMFLIDIAVPRNVEPSVNELDNVFVYDIDDLQRVVDDNLRGRMNEAADASRIIEEEVADLQVWLRTRAIGPAIADVQDSLERIRQAELDRLRGKLGALTPQQEQAIEQLTRGLVNKIAHGPIAELRRQAVNANGSAVVESIRNMFRLEAKPVTAPRREGDS